MSQEYAFELVRRLAALGIYTEAKPMHGSYVIQVPAKSLDNIEALIDLGETHWAKKYSAAPIPARHRDDYDPEPDYDRPTRYDIGPDGEV